MEVKTKICSKCKIEKLYIEFYKNKGSKDGLASNCKECRRRTANVWRANNKDKVAQDKRNWRVTNKDRHTENNRQWKAVNFDTVKENNYQWQIANRDKVNHNNRKWKANNKDQITAHCRNRSASDPLFKLMRNVRSRMSHSFKNKGYSKTTRTFTILGLDGPTFYEYLLTTFQKNYNRPYDPQVDKVHIDHIIPIASATTEEEIIKLNHYTNLQLLLAEDNLKKSDKLPHEWSL